MNFKILFKRLILANLFISIIFVITSLSEVESGMVVSFNQSFEIPDLFFYLILIWIFVYFINIYFLYNFKKIGKPIFLILFLTSIFLTLISGPIAMDPWFYALDGLGMSINGALLLMLYYTPIKKEF